MSDPQKIPNRDWLTNPQTGRAHEAARLHKGFRKMLEDPQTTPEQKDKARRSIKLIDGLMNAKRRKVAPKA